MVEYASVRSSLYDIDALVTQLNERADEGWEVVQILPTGGDVTAVLRRSPEADKPPESAAGYGEAAPVTLYDTGEYEVTAAEAVADDGTVEEVVVASVVSEDTRDDVPESVAASVDEAASEPPGWAVAPVAVEETDTTDRFEDTQDAPVDATATVAAEAASDREPDRPSEPPTEAAPVVAAAAAEPAPEPTPAPTPPPAPAPAAPAGIPGGWYPDPSGRFELRYWDGAAWTEHVARAGQMYTDPPVA